MGNPGILLAIAMMTACGSVGVELDAEAPDASADAAAALDAAWPDAPACAAPIEQPPPCESCCQLFSQAGPGEPICPECRITVSISGGFAVKPGMCETDQPCCVGRYQGLCP